MKIRVVANNNQIEMSKKEKQIIQIAILNIQSLINAIVTKKGMVSNPLQEKPEVLGYEVFLDPSVSKEEEEEFIRRITNQIGMFLEMSEVPYSVDVEK